ncbi:beta-glucan synthesis-associated protein-domain-containing protein, partial [Mycena capillaripes]
QFALSVDPTLWGSNISPHHAEADDSLHNPEFENGKVVDRPSSSELPRRGMANIGCLQVVFLAIAIVGGGVGVNTTVQVRIQDSFYCAGLTRPPCKVAAIGKFGLIDLDTPPEAYIIKSLYSGRDMKLVFSDEFNTDGRSFYPGDDPYWEAVDLHYWAVSLFFSRFFFMDSCRGKDGQFRMVW